MLDASSEPGELVSIQFAVLLMVGPVLLIIGAILVFSGGWEAGTPSFSDMTLGLYVCIYIGFQFLLSPRLEFRQHGIVTAYAFHRWSRIESFHWEDDTKDKVMLRINLLGGHPFWQSVRVQVPSEKKAEADRVLTRFLSEWPMV